MDVLFKWCLVNECSLNCSRLPVLMTMALKEISRFLCVSESIYSQFCTPDSNTQANGRVSAGTLQACWMRAGNSLTVQEITGACREQQHPSAGVTMCLFLQFVCVSSSRFIGSAGLVGTSHNKRQFLIRESDCRSEWKNHSHIKVLITYWTSPCHHQRIESCDSCLIK